MEINVVAQGAVGDGLCDSTKALQTAITHCAKAGGGRVIVPAGHYRSGSLRLGDGVELHLEAGAVLTASLNPEDYPELPDSVSPRDFAFLNAIHAKNVSLTGEGTISGNSMSFFHDDPDCGGNGEEHLSYDDPKQFRPKLVRFEDVENLHISGITLKDSAFWTLHLAGCRQTVIENIRIENHRRACNSDAIDIDCCRDVLIRNSFLQTGDDALCVKSTREAAARYGICENIRMERCATFSNSAALKIGTETFGDIRNIEFRDCTIDRSSHAIALYARDGGNISDIRFSGIRGTAIKHGNAPRHKFHWTWWGSGDAIFISAVPRRKGENSGTIRQVFIENTVLAGENSCFISSYPEHGKVEEIFLKNCVVRFEKNGTQPTGIYDEMPSFRNRFPHDAPAFFLENVRKITMENCSVEYTSPPSPDWRREIENQNSTELQLDCRF